MSERCPFCASTDICDLTDGRCECLDCGKAWQPTRRWEVPPWMKGATDE